MLTAWIWVILIFSNFDYTISLLDLEFKNLDILSVSISSKIPIYDSLKVPSYSLEYSFIYFDYKDFLKLIRSSSSFIDVTGLS